MNHIEVIESRKGWEMREVDAETGYTVGVTVRKKHLDDVVTMAVLWIEESEYQINRIEFKFLD